MNACLSNDTSIVDNPADFANESTLCNNPSFITGFFTNANTSPPKSPGILILSDTDVVLSSAIYSLSPDFFGLQDFGIEKLTLTAYREDLEAAPPLFCQYFCLDLHHPKGRVPLDDVQEFLEDLGRINTAQCIIEPASCHPLGLWPESRRLVSHFVRRSLAKSRWFPTGGSVELPINPLNDDIQGLLKDCPSCIECRHIT